MFKVHDNTAVYFEPGAFVRARIVQTEKKVMRRAHNTLTMHTHNARVYVVYACMYVSYACNVHVHVYVCVCMRMCV